MRLIKPKLLTLLAVILCITMFSIPAYAADGGEELLSVNAAWVDGEMIRISVTDINGVNSAFALRRTDYISEIENSEYISVQAVDLEGNKSGVVQIKNPYYMPISEPAPNTDEVPDITVEVTPPETSESAIPDGNPFTPEGSGTVIDNAHDGDGKEFFTIGTEDGSVFYLIVDRQRNSDNVYLLNAVTLDDLIALAEKREKPLNVGNGSTSAIQTPEQSDTETDIQNPPQSASTEKNAEQPDKPHEKNNTIMYIIIGVAVIAAGGIGYYFKIVKGKKNIDTDDDEDNYGHEEATNEQDGDDSPDSDDNFDEDDISEDGGGEE